MYFTLVATAIQISYLANQFAPLALLNGGPSSSGFTSEQVQALAYLPIRLDALSCDISSVFFAFYGLTIGYLVFRSMFLPRFIGLLLMIGALSYLTYGLADLLAPGFAAHLVPWVQLPSLIGEGSFCLWMLFAGLNLERWNEYASNV